MLPVRIPNSASPDPLHEGLAEDGNIRDITVRSSLHTNSVQRARLFGGFGRLIFCSACFVSGFGHHVLDSWASHVRYVRNVCDVSIAIVPARQF